MKRLLTTILIVFTMFTVSYSQTAALNAANQAMYKAISPVSNTSVSYVQTVPTLKGSSTSIYNYAVLQKVECKECDALIKLWNTGEIPKIKHPSDGLINNPNQKLFLKNTRQNLNYATTFPIR